jgi:hypothetical protein
MTALAEAPAFTAGVRDGMPEDEYHGDPVPGGSLSASGAKLLLPPSCPARFWHERQNPPPPKDSFEFGTAAHRMVLGSGPDVTVVDAPDWRTKKAKDAAAEARENGYVPVLPHEWLVIVAMADTLRKHPVASVLLDREHGKPEQSLFWEDDETGIWRRARLDFLPDVSPGRRLVIPDYKTAVAADAESFRRAAAKFSYHMQAAQYIDGVRALGLDDDPAFLFIVQEKAAPYLVNVIGLEDGAIEAGRDRMRTAAEIFRDCTAAGYWPGYSDNDITYISLPPWAQRTGEDFE